MKISVIIPVYNAELYIQKTIQSALDQPQVSEIIVVDDAYPDNAIQIANSMAKTNSKIKIYQHPDNKNHGAGASRNLGIKKSTCEYIAFLDADDYYLPHRFKKTIEVFKAHHDVDGVYEAIGFHNYTDVDLTPHGRHVNGQFLTTIESGIPPSAIFKSFLLGNKGWWSLDGFTIKKQLIEKTGLFDTNLKLTQDTDFILRTCLYGNLVGGLLDQPVAMRGVHQSNRILQKENMEFYRFQFYKKWFHLALKNNWSPQVNYYLFRTLISSYPLKTSSPPLFKAINYLTKLFFAVSIIIRHPRLLFKIF